MRFLPLQISVAVCLACPVTPAASAEALINELDFLADEPIEFSATTRLKQAPQNIPAAVTLIDRDMIEASSATTIPELLRLVPGFQVGSKWGNETAVTYHGLSGEVNTRLHVLVDGRSVYDPALGGTLWQNLPISMDEIKSIEVVRGPNAAAYGANSFSGVINIKTYAADELEGTQISALYGKQREATRVGVMHSGKKDALSYRLSTEYEQNSGHEDAKLDRYPDFSDWYDDLEHTQINTQFALQSGKVLHRLDIGLKELSLGAGIENARSLGLLPSQKEIFSYSANYRWQQQPSLLLRNRLQLSHSYMERDGKIVSVDGAHDTLPAHNGPNLVDLPDITINGVTYSAGFDSGDHPIYELYDLITHRLDLEFDHQRIVSPALQFVAGAGLRYDYAQSQAYFQGASHDRFSSRLFAHAEWKPLQPLVFNLGGLWEQHEDIDDYFSPRAAVNWHVHPNHTLKTIWSRAYRVPSLIDENVRSYSYDLFDDLPHDFDSLGNPDLIAEQMTSLEIGYLGRFFNNRMNIELRLAHEEIRDAIDTRKTSGGPTGRGKRNINLPEFRTLNYAWVDLQSAELAVSIRPSNSTFFKAHAAYTNTEGVWPYQVDIYSNTSVFDGPLELFVPQLTTGILVSHQFPNRLRLSAQYAFVEAYFAGGAGDNLDAMETLDLKLAKEFTVGGQDIEVLATIKNIADSPYQDFDRDNVVRLESFVQVKMDLN